MEQQVEIYTNTCPTVIGQMLYTSTDWFMAVMETDFIPHHRVFSMTFYNTNPVYAVICLRFTEASV
jgi:hypothetical protein